MYRYTHTHYQREIASSWEPAVYTGGFSLVLCDEGLGGREPQEGGYICVHLADCHCWTAETNTASYSKYIPIIKNSRLVVDREKKNKKLRESLS